MPYILKPVHHRAIWGGHRLAKLLGVCPDDLAHLYLVSSRKDMSSQVANTGMDLRELFSSKKSAWNMEKFSEFPLTIALVDASQNLSVQVHPDAELASELEGAALGKTESWYFLETPPTGWIYGGCECASVEEIKEKIEKGEIENVISRFKVKLGDCICARAGALHALTAGSLVYEVEFGSDFTYRFYDYGRLDKDGKPRSLDVDKALAALDLDKKPSVSRADEDGWIREKEYELCVIRDVLNYRNEGDRLECLGVINGNGTVAGFSISEPTAILLEPGEELQDLKIDFGISARLGRANED